MKKLTGFIVAAAIAIAPMTASALEALTDNAMNDVTAQAGVSIGIDDIVIYKNVGETRYIDTDGNGVVTGDVGALVVSGDESLTKLNSIKSDIVNMYGIDWGSEAGVAAADVYNGAKRLTIDVGLATIGYDNADGTPNAFDTCVIIGLPTIAIQKTASTQTIGLAATDVLGDGTEENFGTIKKGASTTAILGGKITIAPH